jgi:hypothetical protein
MGQSQQQPHPYYEVRSTAHRLQCMCGDGGDGEVIAINLVSKGVRGFSSITSSWQAGAPFTPYAASRHPGEPPRFGSCTLKLLVIIMYGESHAKTLTELPGGGRGGVHK